MPVYFVCPGSSARDTAWFFEANSIKFDGIVCAMERPSIEMALGLYHRIPSQEPPIPTDLLISKGMGREREPLHELQLSYPEMEFLDHFDTCEFADKSESDALLYDRAIRGCMVARLMGVTSLVVAPPDVIHSLAGIHIQPGQIHTLD